MSVLRNRTDITYNRFGEIVKTGYKKYIQRYVWSKNIDRLEVQYSRLAAFIMI